MSHGMDITRLARKPLSNFFLSPPLPSPPLSQEGYIKGKEEKQKVVLCFSPPLSLPLRELRRKEGRTPLSWEYDLREFQRYPFSELFSSAGESLHTP